MTGNGTGAALDRGRIVEDLTGIIGDIVQDWDLDFTGGISESTALVADLGFQSIDVVMLVGEIHKHYGRRDLPFEKLLVSEGSYAREITVRDLADFLHQHLGGGAGPAASTGGGV